MACRQPQFATFLCCFLLLLLPTPTLQGPPLAMDARITACYVGYVTCLASYGIVAGTPGPIGWLAWFVNAPAVCSAALFACLANYNDAGVVRAMPTII